jgi:DNA-binding response OmpR family regulator
VEDFPRNASRGGASDGLRILIVDDDENCLESLGAFLSFEGHYIFTASRGLEAIDFARRCRRAMERLDLSILDYHMPDHTGTEIFRELMLELPGTQAIFISGDPSRALEREVEEVGGYALVTKPLDLYRVRSLIAKFSGGASQGAEAMRP